ncbi:MAG: asparaginase [Candidatus Cloacimonadaceae bacterium]|nr:asparaginase [Candidatus Cloacimonadaceae bacterium]
MKIAIFTTGGTIAQKFDPEQGGLVPAVSGKDLVASVPQLGTLAQIEVFQVANIDSSHMTPGIWASLSKKVDRELAGDIFAGAVVVHGTDTMAEGAYFLSLTLTTEKPVVFTGSMRSAFSLSADGPINLFNSVLTAATTAAFSWGVTVCINDCIFDAFFVQKTDTLNVNAFSSGPKGLLGIISGNQVVKLNEVIHRQHVVLTDKKNLPQVVLIPYYAGDDGRQLRTAADHGADGVVLEAVGAGNVGPKMREAAAYAISKKVPVVIARSVHWGPVAAEYGSIGGGADLRKTGAILAPFGLTARKTQILLTLALAHASNGPALEAFFQF